LTQIKTALAGPKQLELLLIPFFGEVVISLGSRLSAPGFLHGHAFKIVHQVPRADITRVIDT
jgi:hypothetical protein